MQKRHRIDVREALAGFALFAELSAVRRGELAEFSRVAKVDKGEMIFPAGDPPRDLFLLLTGHVKRASFSRGGNEKVVDLVFPGQCFGEAELLASQPYGSYAIAVETSYLICIDGEAVRRCLEHDSRLARAMLVLLATRQAHMERDLAASHFRTGCERVLDYLMDNASAVPSTAGQTVVDLPSSKHLIASRLGIAPETLSRSLRELSDRGLIAVDGRFILLRNAALAEFLDESRGGRHPGRPDEQARAAGKSGRVRDSADREEDRITLLRAVSVAGRQRMLSQRLAKAWLLLGQGVQPGRSSAMLRHSAELFEQQLGALARLAPGGPVAEAQRVLAEVWRPYREHLDRAPSRDAAGELLHLSEDVLGAAQDLTLAVERLAGTAQARLVNIAGRERMLSQRLAHLYLFREWEVQADHCRAAMDEASGEFRAALPQLFAAAAAPAAKTQMERVARCWNLLDTVLSAPDALDRKRRNAAVSAASETLLRQAEKAVELFEAAAEPSAAAA
ncbi:MAG TPA: type IV pili methyl-accepting chemotaxis transducer N-terminal domain-containing protein [Rhodocyclaceae bacterium]|nr:type IV pili methyl-accepting chemotaxis transducer N-terminal domain-containing protein [Rhodocyclaceae bacterium]